MLFPQKTELFIKKILISYPQYPTAPPRIGGFWDEISYELITARQIKLLLKSRPLHTGIKMISKIYELFYIFYLLPYLKYNLIIYFFKYSRQSWGISYFSFSLLHTNCNILRIFYSVKYANPKLRQRY